MDRSSKTQDPDPGLGFQKVGNLALAELAQGFLDFCFARFYGTRVSAKRPVRVASVGVRVMLSRRVWLAPDPGVLPKTAIGSFCELLSLGLSS